MHIAKAISSIFYTTYTVVDLVVQMGVAQLMWHPNAAQYNLMENDSGIIPLQAHQYMQVDYVR